MRVLLNLDQLYNKKTSGMCPSLFDICKYVLMCHFDTRLVTHAHSSMCFRIVWCKQISVALDNLAQPYLIFFKGVTLTPVNIHTHITLQSHTRRPTRAHTRIHTRARIHTHAHPHTHTHTHTHTHARTHTHTHTHPHTHTYTHTHTYIWGVSK